jgi:hypothetical protein
MQHFIQRISVHQQSSGCTSNSVSGFILTAKNHQLDIGLNISPGLASLDQNWKHRSIRDVSQFRHHKQYEHQYWRLQHHMPASRSACLGSLSNHQSLLGSPNPSAQVSFGVDLWSQLELRPRQAWQNHAPSQILIFS